MLHSCDSVIVLGLELETGPYYTTYTLSVASTQAVGPEARSLQLVVSLAFSGKPSGSFWTDQ